MGKKVKLIVKASSSDGKSRAIKPKLGRGTGGILPVSLKAKVKKDKETKRKGNG